MFCILHIKVIICIVVHIQICFCVVGVQFIITHIHNYENSNCKKITHTFQDRVKTESKKKVSPLCKTWEHVGKVENEK